MVPASGSDTVPWVPPQAVPDRLDVTVPGMLLPTIAESAAADGKVYGAGSGGGGSIVGSLVAVDGAAAGTLSVSLTGGGALAPAPMGYGSFRLTSRPA
jgi:hypothetical protein